MTDERDYDDVTAHDDELDDFDPLAPIEFDEDEEEDEEERQDYYARKLPAIAESIEESAAARRAKYPVPQLTREEKIAKALKGMPGQKKLLLHIVDWCREERESDELLQEIVAFQRGGVNVYSPESIVATLVRCEAIEQTNAPSKDEQVDEATVALADTEDTEAQRAFDDSTVADAIEDVPQKEGEPEPVETEAPADPVEGEDVEYLEVKKPEPARYLATKEGLDAVEAEDPAARFAQFMDVNPVYAPIFRTILEACDCEGGCVKKHIDELVDHDPICMEPRRFSGYFIDKLEDADAIIFEGTWKTTDVGRAMLEEGGLIGSL